jgi:membrane fusion protein, multidrug efflux system
MKNSLLTFFAVTGVLLMLVSSSGCSDSGNSMEPETKTTEERIVQVSVEEVQPAPIRDVLVLPGETEAWQDVRVAADTTGRVEWIGPQEGDTIKKNQLLVKIDVSALKTARDRAQCAYDLAKELYKRRVKLFDRNAISQEALDLSDNEKTVALHALKQADVEYERGFTRSPINGIINHLFVDEGEFIERGKPLADLVNVNKIKINVNVPELDVRYLKMGQETMVTIDAYPDKKLMGKVDFVAYKADPATKTFLVRVLVDNPHKEIRPGMIARLAFLRRVIPDAISAPLFALVDKGGERILYVEKDGVAHSRTASLGVIDGERIQITKGLEPGDRLIVAGQTQVEEGMKVRAQ